MFSLSEKITNPIDKTGNLEIANSLFTLISHFPGNSQDFGHTSMMHHLGMKTCLELPHFLPLSQSCNHNFQGIDPNYIKSFFEAKNIFL